MKRSSTIFLRTIIVLIGIGALIRILWEPILEGRNAHATLFQIYFNDPFLIWAQIASIAFFIAFYRTFNLLGYRERNEVFSERSVKALQTITYCAMTIVAFAVGAKAYLCIVRPGDDIAGGIFMGLFMIAVFGISVSVAAMFERILQNAVNITSKNDLTV